MIKTNCFLVVLVAFTCSSCQGKIQNTNGTIDPTEIKSVITNTVNEPGSPMYDSGDIVTRGFLDASGTMWFTTTKEGVFSYDGISFTRHTVEDGLCGNQVWAVTQDSDGVMWFGTENGLCSYDGDHFKNFPIPSYTVTSDWLEEVYPVVNPNAIVSLIQDRKGNLWVGSNGAGVYKYDGENFESFLTERGQRMPDNLHHNVVLGIVEDRMGDIWFASFSQGGVSQFTDGRFVHYALADGFGEGMICSLYIDRKHNLWVGSRNGGIYRYKNETFVNVKDSNRDNQIAMATFFEDSKGTFWVGSYARKGVYTYNGSAFIPFDVENSSKLLDIKTIAEDKNGNIWFGGRYGLLWRFDGKELIDFTFAKRG